MSVLSILAVSSAGLALAAVWLAIRSFRASRHLRGGTALAVGVVLAVVAGLGATLSAATRGFRALTHEEVAARVEVRPKPDQAHAFEATVHLPNQSERSFEVRGDQLYVDARIVKWHPWANVLGLHTAYELDRLGGRYRDARMAEQAPRTVHPLGRERSIEVTGLLDRIPLIERLVDAEYGSATFVDVDRERHLEVRVSTSGLLIREAEHDSESE